MARRRRNEPEKTRFDELKDKELLLRKRLFQAHAAGMSPQIKEQINRLIDINHFDIQDHLERERMEQILKETPDVLDSAIHGKEDEKKPRQTDHN